MRVLRDASGWERPSDHAPVMISWHFVCIRSCGAVDLGDTTAIVAILTGFDGEMGWRLLWGAIRLVVASRRSPASIFSGARCRSIRAAEAARSVCGSPCLARRLRRAARFRRLDGRRRARPRLPARERAAFPDGVAASDRPRSSRRDIWRGSPRRRQVRPHAGLVPRGRKQLRRIVAFGAEATCRPTRTASTPSATVTERPAAGVPARRATNRSPGSRPIRWFGASSMALQLSNNYASSRRSVRASAQRLGPDQAKWLFPGQSRAIRSRRCRRSTRHHASIGSVEDEIGAP